MTPHEIDILIKQGEGIRIEFKEATDSVHAAFYETVVSFSNTDGGTILLGVNDDGKVLGINPTAKAKLLKDIVSSLNIRDKINPPLYLQPFTVEHTQGLIIVVQVPASSQVHDHKGHVFIREFESDIDINENITAISDLHLRKRNLFTESQIYPALSMSDFNSDLFIKARNIIRSYKGDHPWLQMNDEEMLASSMLWRKDFQTFKEGYTLAAALIFGKDTTIQSILPAYKVEAMLRKENKDRWDDRITLRTNLIDTYLELKQFVNRHLPDKFYMESDQRIDLRDKIFREVIGNIIVHREYSSAFSTELIITETEVTTTNPNKALFHGLLDLNSFSPYPKNPNIRKFFTSFGWTDEIGSGIKNTKKYLPLYVHDAQPIFREDDIFLTIIPVFTYLWSDRVDILIQFLGFESEKFDQLRVKELKNLPLYSDFDLIDNNEFFYKKGSSWYKKGVNLLSYKQNNISYLGFDEFKKESSWSEKGVNLLSKKLVNLIKLMVISIIPSSMDELLMLMEFKSRDKLRELYLSPLRKMNFIETTIKEKPNAPGQKYVITKAGKAFLGGI